MKDKATMKDKVLLTCETCEYVSSTKVAMKKHSITHSEDLQTCPECGKIFPTSKGLLLHKAKLHKMVNASGNETQSGDEMKTGVEDENDSTGYVNSKDIVLKTDNNDRNKITKTKKSKKKSSKKKSKQELKPSKDWESLEGDESKSKLSLFNQIEPVHQNQKVSAFDFWSDGEDDFKLLWLYEMGSTCPPLCHFRACHPCTRVCCENSVVRAGLCCDTATLGRCLQPYQEQCFAPCCHHSVQLRDNFRWVGDRVEDVDSIALYNPLELEQECEFGNEVLKDAMQVKDVEYVDNTISDVKDEDAPECLKNSREDYVPQVFTNQSITKYLDAKLGKVIPKSNFERQFFKFYKDSTLPRGCRIVLKKSEGSVKVEVFFRSKCGRFFNSRAELSSYVDRCVATEKEDKKISTFKKISWIESLEMKSKEFADNLYQNTEEMNVDDRNDFMKCPDGLVKDTKDGDGSLMENSGEKCVNHEDEIKDANDKMNNGSPLADNKRSMCDDVFTKSEVKKTIKIAKYEEAPRIKIEVKLDITRNIEYVKKPQSMISEHKSDSRSIPTKLPLKVGGKICRCEECDIILPMTDVTKHLVTKHPGLKMNRCTICKSGFMNINSFQRHNQEIHPLGESSTDLKLLVHQSKSVESKENNRSSGIKASSALYEKVRRVPTVRRSDDMEKASVIKDSDDEFAECNTNTSDLNDSVETLDKIEHFLNNSTNPMIQKVKHKIPSYEKVKPIAKSVLPKSTSTPSPSHATNSRVKKISEAETMKGKRNRSMSDVPIATRKRSRISYLESVSETPVQDTDPNHPTSSLRLRMKGRIFKGGKKLSPMGILTMYNKYTLDSNTTINDIVDGEVLVFKSVRPELVFSISAEETTIKDLVENKFGNDDGRSTNSDILRRKGRDHRGERLLEPFWPLLNYHEDIVKDNIIDKEDPSVATIEKFFTISS